MTPEGRVKQSIDKILKVHSVYFTKPRGTTFGRSGVPDYDCIAYGNNCFKIEAKAGKKEPTALQKIDHEERRKRGGIVFVINEDNLTLLEEYLKSIEANKYERYK